MHVTRSSPHAAAMSRHHHSRTHDDALLIAIWCCERASRAAGAVVAYGAGLGRGACPHTPVDAANRPTKGKPIRDGWAFCRRECGVCAAATRGDGIRVTVLSLVSLRAATRYRR